jgi:hypothetical protein
MKFDVVVTQEVRWTRVEVQGRAGLGRLLSLLKVLELDSRTWGQAAVLLDLRGFSSALGADEQREFMAAAVAGFGGKRVAFLAAPGTMPAADGVFNDEASAHRWLRP